MGNRINQRESGFTLIELIVVIVLLGLMFSFAAPKMEGFLFSGDTDKVSRWLTLNITELKRKAARDQKTYILNADSTENIFYISTPEMEEDAIEEARKNGYTLPETVRVVEIIFPFESEESSVYFYPKGYSDTAIIHIENRSGNQLSFIVEPFLTEVQIRKGFVLF